MPYTIDVYDPTKKAAPKKEEQKPKTPTQPKVTAPAQPKPTTPAQTAPTAATTVKPFEERYKEWYSQYGSQLESALAKAKTPSAAQQAVQKARTQAGVETAAPTVRTTTTKEEPAYERTARDLRAEYEDFTDTVRSQTREYFDQMNAYAKQMSDAALTMYKMYQDQLANAITLLQQQMQPSTQVPDSVKIAINELRQAVTDNSRVLAEEMNNRGILQSGIAAEEERKLREKGMTEEQKLLAGWLDQEHEKITRAVFQLANLYAQTAAPSAQMWYQAATTGPQLGMQLAQQAYQTERELAGQGFDFLSKLRQWEAEQQAAAEQAAAEAQREAEQFQWEQYKTMLPYQYLTAQQRAQLDLDYQRLAETVRHQQATEKLQAEANRQRADYYGWLREKGVTEQEISRNTSDVIADIMQMDPNNPDEMKAYIADHAQHWVSDVPIKIDDVLQWIKYKFPGQTGQQITLQFQSPGGRTITVK